MILQFPFQLYDSLEVLLWYITALSAKFVSEKNLEQRKIKLLTYQQKYWEEFPN